jgi:hypothetical protein
MATLPNRKTADIKPADQLAPPQTQQAVIVGKGDDTPLVERPINIAERPINMSTPEHASTTDDRVVTLSVPTPVVTFHVAQSRKILMANALSRIALKPPQVDDSHNGDAITLFWNPRPAANASPADPQSISIGAQNAPRMVYTGYGCTIPAGYRGIVVSLPEHGPVRPLMYLLAGKHDIDLAVPHSYAGSNVHGVQIGPCAAVGRLILEKSVVVQCEVDEG